MNSDELIDVTNRHNLFKNQARYLVEKQVTCTSHTRTCTTRTHARMHAHARTHTHTRPYECTHMHA